MSLDTIGHVSRTIPGEAPVDTVPTARSPHDANLRTSNWGNFVTPSDKLNAVLRLFNHYKGVPYPSLSFKFRSPSAIMGSKGRDEYGSDANTSDRSISRTEKVVNGTSKRKAEDGEGSKKKKKKSPKVNGHGSSLSRRRLSAPARDPRDEASPPTPVFEGSPTPPVIDFDGLSHPSKHPALPLQVN